MSIDEMSDDELDELYDDDPETYDAWLDHWLGKCGALIAGISVCPLAGTEEHDFECPFRTKSDARPA